MLLLLPYICYNYAALLLQLFAIRAARCLYILVFASSFVISSPLPVSQRLKGLVTLLRLRLSHLIAVVCHVRPSLQLSQRLNGLLAVFLVISSHPCVILLSFLQVSQRLKGLVAVFRESLGVTVPPSLLSSDIFQLTAVPGHVLKQRCDAVVGWVGRENAAQVRGRGEHQKPLSGRLHALLA